MPSKSKRLLLPKRLRPDHSFTQQKFTRHGGKVVIARIEKCIMAVLSTMREIMPEKRNITIHIFRAALNMMCLNAKTLQTASKDDSCRPLLRQTAVYNIIKKFFPRVGVCASTTKCMTAFFNALTEELIMATKTEANKSRRSMLTERDIQIATLYVENVCVLLKGCNDAAFVPSKN